MAADWQLRPNDQLVRNAAEFKHKTPELKHNRRECFIAVMFNVFWMFLHVSQVLHSDIYVAFVLIFMTLLLVFRILM